jgi:hypothetical protein
LSKENGKKLFSKKLTWTAEYNEPMPTSAAQWLIVVLILILTAVFLFLLSYIDLI